VCFYLKKPALALNTQYQTIQNLLNLKTKLNMMKTIRILIPAFVIMFTLSTTATSQGITGGFKGGLTMSNLYIDRDDLDDENARFGFHGGLFSQMMLADILGFQPELLFTTKGTEGVYGGIINQTVQFNMNYIEVPFLLVVKPVDLIEIHAGPYIGLLVSSNVKYSGTIDGESEISRDHFNSLDYGLSAGFALNFGTIQTGLRYNLGVQELADSDTSRMMLGDSKHSYGQLYIAIRVPSY
jgi:hypothetical protein